MNILNNLFAGSQINLIAKVIFLVVDFAFIIYLTIAIRQVSSMNHIVNDSNDASLIRTAVFSLLFFAVSLFLIALVIL